MKSSKQSSNSRSKLVRIVCVALCLLLLIPLVVNALVIVASAASSSEIKKELDALKSQANEIAAQGDALEADLAANESETQTTIEQKVAIDLRISQTEQEIQNVNAQIQQYNLLIAQKQSELEDSLEEQELMNEKYKARLRAMEESGKISYWSILFRANSFSDLLSRIDSIHEVAEADNRMLKEMEALSDQIQKDREELKEEMAAQEAVKEELAVMEQTLQQQREEANKLLLQLADEYNNLSDEFLAIEEKEEELRAEILAAQAAYEAALSAEEAARLAAANANNAAGGNGGSTSSGSGAASGAGSSGGSFSGFRSPLNYLTVTCAYGWRIHPIWGDKRFHSGVDLAGNQGDPIYAIASGTVTGAGYNDAYGYNVSISHGGGYGSMYAHMTSFTVSGGQYVNQGQVIGYVGSTGWSTGPHLHFEIYVNGGTVNPMDYIG